MISAILSSFNEANNPIFWDNLGLLKSDAEVIVIDGGSADGTLQRMQMLGFRPEVLVGSNRAKRYNRGIERAKGNLILLVHPRTQLNSHCISALKNLQGKTCWGGFTHKFDRDHPLLRFTSWYSNYGRGRRGIIYLDHCLFFSSDLREYAVFPNVDVFEETFFCRSLRSILAPTLLAETAVTSSIRFSKNGMAKQIVINQLLKAGLTLGLSPNWMNRIYERGLSLNQPFSPAESAADVPGLNRRHELSEK